MWKCANCGTSVVQGTICPECGQLSNEALAAINRKVRDVRLRRGVGDRYFWRGAKVGLVVGLILSLIFLAIGVSHGLNNHEKVMEIMERMGILLPVFLVAACFLALLSAVLFLIFGTVVKPIFVAVFCSIERFEQDYGPTQP